MRSLVSILTQYSGLPQAAFQVFDLDGNGSLDVVSLPAHSLPSSGVGSISVIAAYRMKRCVCTPNLIWQGRRAVCVCWHLHTPDPEDNLLDASVSCLAFGSGSLVGSYCNPNKSIVSPPAQTFIAASRWNLCEGLGLEAMSPLSGSKHRKRGRAYVIK